MLARKEVFDMVKATREVDKKHGARILMMSRRYTICKGRKHPIIKMIQIEKCLVDCLVA